MVDEEITENIPLSPHHRNVSPSPSSSRISHLLNSKAPIVYATKPKWLQGPLCVDDISEIREAVNSYYETSERKRRQESRRLAAEASGEWKPRMTSPTRRRQRPKTGDLTFKLDNDDGQVTSGHKKRISSAQASFYSAIQCYLPGVKSKSLFDLKVMSNGLKSINVVPRI